MSGDDEVEDEGRGEMRNVERRMVVARWKLSRKTVLGTLERLAARNRVNTQSEVRKEFADV